MGISRLWMFLIVKAYSTTHLISSPNPTTYSAMRKVSRLVCLINPRSRTCNLGNMVGLWTLQTTYREMKIDWYTAGSQTNQVPCLIATSASSFTFLSLWERIQWRLDWYAADSQTNEVQRPLSFHSLFDRNLCFLIYFSVLMRGYSAKVGLTYL